MTPCGWRTAGRRAIATAPERAASTNSIPGDSTVADGLAKTIQPRVVICEIRQNHRGSRRCQRSVRLRTVSLCRLMTGKGFLHRRNGSPSRKVFFFKRRRRVDLHSSPSARTSSSIVCLFVRSFAWWYVAQAIKPKMALSTVAKCCSNDTGEAAGCPRQLLWLDVSVFSEVFHVLHVSPTDLVICPLPRRTYRCFYFQNTTATSPWIFLLAN